ncbi:MAG: hypothetical protein CL927_09780 [Deltaproteobacteria bacterium]|nr:hypothetical protein [Deltaproteobacteria bacterium]HCH66403.1 hypothetical protein [Deltaproteobacteria bacterium]
MALDRAAGRAMWGLSRGAAVERTCADFDDRDLDVQVGHVVLTGCEMHVDVSSVVFSGPDLVTAYVPLQVAGRPMVSNPIFLLRTNDPDFLATLMQLLRDDPEDPHVWLRERLDLDPVRIDSTVLRGRHLAAVDAEHLERHQTHLAADAVVIADRASLPSPIPPLCVGLGLGLLALWGLVFPPSGITTGVGSRDGSRLG